MKPRRTSTGFSLLELLVVITLIAVLTGLAVVSVDLAGPERHAEEEARRLALLLGEQCEQAILDSRELGLRFDPEGYRFSIWDGEQWHEYYRPPVFQPRLLPEGFRVDLELQGRPVLLEDDPKNFDPHVVCYSSGEMTPFELAVLPPEPAPGRQVQGQRDGQVELAGWTHEG